MQPAPIPENENLRLQAILNLGILDTAPEERFDVFTRKALQMFGVPIATITIIDKDREWYKSCQGLDVKEAPRAVSFCAHAMLSSNLFIVEDTLKDDRFKDNPMVIGKPYIRFYAGTSLKNKDGIIIGVFCIKDIKPRQFSAMEIVEMLEMARQIESELNSTKLQNNNVAA